MPGGAISNFVFACIRVRVVTAIVTPSAYALLVGMILSFVCVGRCVCSPAVGVATTVGLSFVNDGLSTKHISPMVGFALVIETGTIVMYYLIGLAFVRITHVPSGDCRRACCFHSLL